jgi:hypothetical protein
MATSMRIIWRKPMAGMKSVEPSRLGLSLPPDQKCFGFDISVGSDGVAFALSGSEHVEIIKASESASGQF